MIKLTPGKLAGLKVRLRLTAASSPPPPWTSAAPSRSPSPRSAAPPPTAHDLEEFKTLVTDVLTKHASAILLDPEFGLPASKHRNGKGLLLAYEKTGYDATDRRPPARPARPLERPPPQGSWRRLHQDPPLLHPVREVRTSTTTSTPGSSASATSASPTTSPSSSSSSATTPRAATRSPSPTPRRSPRSSPAPWPSSARRSYNVDVLKVEVPIEMEFVEGTKAFKGEKAYTRAEALQHFRDADGMTHKPFIYLSAGVSNPVFIETLELAGESGTNFNGVLCGRATWKDGIAIYAKQGAKAFEELAQHHRRRKHQQRQQGPRKGAQLAPEGRPARHPARARPRINPLIRTHKERRVSGALFALTVRVIDQGTFVLVLSLATIAIEVEPWPAEKTN